MPAHLDCPGKRAVNSCLVYPTPSHILQIWQSLKNYNNPQISSLKQCIYVSMENTLCLKKCTLRLIWHNFTNIYWLFLVQRQRLYSILNWLQQKVFNLAENQLCGFHNNSRDLTHCNSEFLLWLRILYYRQGNKRVARRLRNCVKAERLHFKHLL